MLAGAHDATIQGKTAKTMNQGDDSDSLPTKLDETIEIRRLERSDWSQLKELRIHGGENSPNAFGVTLEELKTKPDESYQDMITNDYYFGAFLRSTNQLVGCMGFYQGKITKMKHRGTICSVYVRPESRGLGIGRALIETIIRFVKENKPEIIQLHLSVGVLNEPALRLYQLVGFEIYGTEPRSLISEVDGLEYVDEYLMWLKLK